MQARGEKESKRTPQNEQSSLWWPPMEGKSEKKSIKAGYRRGKVKSSSLTYLWISEGINSGQLASIHYYQICIIILSLSSALPSSPVFSGCLFSSWTTYMHLGRYFQVLLFLWMRMEDRKKKTSQKPGYLPFFPVLFLSLTVKKTQNFILEYQLHLPGVTRTKKYSWVRSA